ncbi:MAG: vWA domain-containing protein [Pseudomonadota bacterium]
MIGLLIVHVSLVYAADTVAETRVLIDVSGSMKETDPKNLRKTALTLFINLLPINSKASVDIFDADRKNIIPFNVVNMGWKKKSTQHIQKIHSNGLWTDIGSALDHSLNEFTDVPEEYKTNPYEFSTQRQIVLLTDGKIDVEKSENNSSERQRVLHDVIRKAQSLGIKIHTIALSENADKELLEALALHTEAAYVVADSSEALTEKFLSIMNQATKPEQLPIQGNQFTIDSSIKEFTLLAFRKSDSAPIVLITPEKESITPIRKKDNVQWVTEKEYDLLTVIEPAPGQWTIQGQVDPDSQITIVSDLELNFGKLARHIESQEKIEFNFFLTEDKKTIIEPRFLKLISFEFIQKHADKSWKTLLGFGQPNFTIPSDGIYRIPLVETLLPGENKLKVIVNGRTFQRQKTYQLTVHSAKIPDRPGIDSEFVETKKTPADVIEKVETKSVQTTTAPAIKSPSSKSENKKPLIKEQKPKTKKDKQRFLWSFGFWLSVIIVNTGLLVGFIIWMIKRKNSKDEDIEKIEKFIASNSDEKAPIATSTTEPEQESIETASIDADEEKTEVDSALSELGNLLNDQKK